MISKGLFALFVIVPAVIGAGFALLAWGAHRIGAPDVAFVLTVPAVLLAAPVSVWLMVRIIRGAAPRIVRGAKQLWGSVSAGTRQEWEWMTRQVGVWLTDAQRAMMPPVPAVHIAADEHKDVDAADTIELPVYRRDYRRDPLTKEEVNDRARDLLREFDESDFTREFNRIIENLESGGFHGHNLTQP